MASGWYSKSIVDKVEIGSNLPVDPSIIGSIYNQEPVIAGLETDIVSYTVPANRLLVLAAASASTGTDTIFRLYVDGDIKEVKRNAWTERNVFFSIYCHLTEGQIVRITGEHHALTVHDMDASLICSLHVVS